MLSLLLSQSIAIVWLLRMLVVSQNLSVRWVHYLLGLLFLMGFLGSVYQLVHTSIINASLGAIILISALFLQAKRVKSVRMEWILAVWSWSCFLPISSTEVHVALVFWSSHAVVSWLILGVVCLVQHQWVERGSWGNEGDWPPLIATLNIYSILFIAMLVCLGAAIVSGFLLTPPLSYSSSLPLFFIWLILLGSFLFGFYQQWRNSWLLWLHAILAGILVCVGVTGHLI